MKKMSASEKAYRAGRKKMAKLEEKLCQPIQGVDLTGKEVILNPTMFKGEMDDRRFVCTTGFGCTPVCIGKGVYGKFICDGEECRVERGEIVGLAPPRPSRPVHCPVCAEERGVAIPSNCPHQEKTP